MRQIVVESGMRLIRKYFVLKKTLIYRNRRI